MHEFPIGIELQALSAAGLLLVLIMLQLILRPFKDERHNVLDCLSMGSIAAKQLCALAYHHVVVNAVDTVDSELLVAFVSWLVTITVVVINTLLLCHYVVLFTILKMREKNDERRAAVAAAQHAWMTGEPEARSTRQRVWDFVRRKLARGRGADDAAEDESEAARRLRASVSEALEAAVQHAAECDNAIDGAFATVDEAKTAKTAAASERRNVLALKVVADEEIDAEGWVVMEQLPLTVLDAARAKLCCCCRRPNVRFNVETHAIAPLADEPGARYCAPRTDTFDADGTMRRAESVDTMNPFKNPLAASTSGIAGFELSAIRAADDIGNSGDGASDGLRSIRVGGTPLESFSL